MSKFSKKYAQNDRELHNDCYGSQYEGLEMEWCYLPETSDIKLEDNNDRIRQGNLVSINKHGLANKAKPAKGSGKIDPNSITDSNFSSIIYRGYNAMVDKLNSILKVLKDD